MDVDEFTVWHRRTTSYRYGTSVKVLNANTPSITNEQRHIVTLQLAKRWTLVPTLQNTHMGACNTRKLEPMYIFKHIHCTVYIVGSVTRCGIESVGVGVRVFG